MDRIAQTVTVGAREARAAAAERSRVRSEQAATKRRLFGEDGEYVPRSELFDGRLSGVIVPDGTGQTIYGGGAWWVIDENGLYVWYVRNNGADGDDWSRNNIQTGGAGAVGVRYPMTAERSEFLVSLPAFPRERDADEIIDEYYKETV